MATLKKREVRKSRTGPKVNIGLLRKLQPTKVSKSRVKPRYVEVSISDVRKESDFSYTGAKWNLRYLKENLKPEEPPKEAEKRPKPSASELSTREAAEISLLEGNVSKKPKPKRGEIRGKGRSEETRRYLL